MRAEVSRGSSPLWPGQPTAPTALLEFCARKNSLPGCETIRMDGSDDALGRMERGDVRYRFVNSCSGRPSRNPEPASDR
jgi:hypothetical protein